MFKRIKEWFFQKVTWPLVVRSILRIASAKNAMVTYFLAVTLTLAREKWQKVYKEKPWNEFIDLLFADLLEGVEESSRQMTCPHTKIYLETDEEVLYKKFQDPFTPRYFCEECGAYAGTTHPYATNE